MKMLNLFGQSMLCVAVFAALTDANAADNSRNSRSMMASVTATNNANANVARMPTMPTVSMNTIGNPAVTEMNVPTQTVHTPTIVPIVPPTPEPKPDPKPETECPDGGVKDSTYTVKMCMNDILQCVNTGGLQGGLHDMFNEDVRNSIMGGMRLCQNIVDKCVTSVRSNCKNIFASSADVWMNFNCDIVQPEYYNFVLRKTGLTPNQAENTCLLLDRNTYGSSFAAVSDMNAVNTEYNNSVNAYNSVGGGLVKDNPQGAVVNMQGYDANRGHYARWDAVNAECLVRVGAYNKDKQITNSWLFGAVGNDNVAEIWQKAGSSFTCSKDLFGFFLLNDTKTAAVVGIAGGTVVGAAIGAGAGAAVYEKKKAEADAISAELESDPCENDEYRAKLIAQIRNTHKASLLRSYMFKNVSYKDGEVDGSSSTPIFKDDNAVYSMDADQCRAIYELYSKAEYYKDAMRTCEENKVAQLTRETVPNVVKKQDITVDGDGVKVQGRVVCVDGYTQQDVTNYIDLCLFKPLQTGLVTANEDNPLCKHDGSCRSINYMRSEMARLNDLLTSIQPVIKTAAVKQPNKGKEIGKGLAIGAATGAGVGGLATAITAFVERSNITCKVGDGLNSVALGKSHTIDSLKDFYVKWNLHLPDSAVPTGTGSNATYANSLEAMCFNFQYKDTPVVLEQEWDNYCHTFDGNAEKCRAASVYYKDKSHLVNKACVMSDGKCVMNKTTFDKVYAQGDS